MDSQYAMPMYIHSQKHKVQPHVSAYTFCANYPFKSSVVWMHTPFVCVSNEPTIFGHVSNKPTIFQHIHLLYAFLTSQEDFTLPHIFQLDSTWSLAESIHHFFFGDNPAKY